jgi:hypothetical protein
LPAAAAPARIWAAPLDEKLTLIAQHRRMWRRVNLCIAAAAVALVLGFAVLGDLLEREGAGALVPMSLALLLLGAGLWLASLVFRVTAMAKAAGTAAPPGFEAVASWAGGLFLAWTVLGNAAVAGYGAAVVRTDYPAAWAGWVAIVLAGAMLVQLAATGDALPGAYHIGPAVLGIALFLA